MKRFSASKRHAIRVAVIYFLIAGCWILFSDWLVAEIITEQTLLSQVHTYKGLLFVLITTGLLYYLINKHTSSLYESSERLEQLVAEKQAVLSELHHRVKNNLAIITGLIELQTQEMEETGSEVLKETQFRIYTLANIEELLYQEGNMTNIPFHKCMDRLVSSLEKSLDSHLSIRSEIDEVNLNINQAVPLALLVNEIFSQFRVNGHKEKLGTISVDVNYFFPDMVSIVLTFDEIADNILSRLTHGGNVEATLINLYAKQLKATSSWKQGDKGPSQFNLEFTKSDKPGSSSQLANAI